jgi:ribose-phosphate pyrophosphokinase
VQNVIVVSNVADNPFAEDIAHAMNQDEDYSDLISLKDFLNTEFCPRFIIDEDDILRIGRKLEDRVVAIVSTSMGLFTRQDLAMRNCLIARAAKDNGASRVILLEPDLYYSAQDRGPRAEHGLTAFPRESGDFRKFDGQPFSARLYADLLKESGVDEVVTVHNHSASVRAIFMDRFSGRFHNLLPSDVYAGYLRDSDIVDRARLVLCAPDKGALTFCEQVRGEIGGPPVPLTVMSKERQGERDVRVTVAESSEVGADSLSGRHVALIDDMTRTGVTAAECCRLLTTLGADRVVVFVTHFYSSREIRGNLNDASVTEIVTTNTIPQILNRDMQGRLRKRIVVLKIERWVASYMRQMLGATQPLAGPLYAEDMSSKNPRWRGTMGPLFSASR